MNNDQNQSLFFKINSFFSHTLKPIFVAKKKYKNKVLTNFKVCGEND